MNMIKEKGDLFDLPEHYTLVHCISEDCVMGAGIAVEFERRFHMRKPLLESIQQMHCYRPFSILYSTPQHDVINMITKKKYWHKPTYDTLSCALNDVVKLCREHNIKYIGMPKIGCGLDRLNWNIVERLITEKFNNLDIEIRVRYL